MGKRALLIFLFILVSAACAGPRAVVTDSISDGGNIRWVHDPKTGLKIKPTFLDGEKYVDGIEARFWICEEKIEVNAEPERLKASGCRERISSTELFGLTNPWYSCGNWPCHFWP